MYTKLPIYHLKLSFQKNLHPIIAIFALTMYKKTSITGFFMIQETGPDKKRWETKLKVALSNIKIGFMI